MKNLILLIVVSFTLSSCHPLFCKWNSKFDAVLQQPDNSEIVGNYILSEDSKEFLKSDLTSWGSRLKLSSDGKFQFYNHKNKIMKEGKWATYCSEECMIELEGITVENLGLNDGKIAVLITLGDGDSCEGLVYEKS